MECITFNFLDQHLHGDAFHQYLKLRKAFFVDELKWDIPHNESVEMDQYDNPCAHYSLVLRAGKVVGGARAMPASSEWGSHTYMLRDAMRGCLSQIPSAAMPADISTDSVWECTRLLVSDEIACRFERAGCLSLVVGGLIDIANRNGGYELVSLSPLPLMRALRQLGFAANRLGEPYRSETDGRSYAVLQMPAMRSSNLMAAE
jgi:N-acyl-L-homoserine lactone synthetase